MVLQRAVMETLKGITVRAWIAVQTIPLLAMPRLIGCPDATYPDLQDDVGMKADQADMKGATKLVCDNNLDDDNDGLPDCSDPDCAATPSCQMVPTLRPEDFSNQTNAGNLSPADFMDRWFDANDPIQPAADRALYNATSAGLMRGKIIDTTGLPIAGAQIDVLKHPGFGHTYSRQNGEFDLLIPGATRAALRVRKSGHPEVQRYFTTPTQARHKMGWSTYRYDALFHRIQRGFIRWCHAIY